MRMHFGVVSFILVTLVLSCKSQREILKNNYSLHPVTSRCPEDGVCSFKVAPKMSVLFKTDEFGIGYVDYFEAQSTLLTFEYQRKTPENTVDGHYNERLYLQLAPDQKALHLKDQELQKVNLLFERICYCKGDTGVYQINSGNLVITPLANNQVHLKLSFRSLEVPQIITELNEIITIP